MRKRAAMGDGPGPADADGRPEDPLGLEGVHTKLKGTKQNGNPEWKQWRFFLG